MCNRRLARRAAGLAVAAALAGFLAACQGTPATEPEDRPKADPAPAEPPASATDAGPIIETGASGPGIANLPPAPPPEPPIDDDPQQLYGLDPLALDALLGQPSLIRSEAPAQIWQYRSRTCVFDVFLYQEAAGPRVSYIEARDDAARKVEPRACLNELLRARKGLAPLG